MRFPTLAVLVALTLVACGGGDGTDEGAPADTTAGAPGGAAGTETATTTTGGPATVATSSEAIGAPEPPQGYAVDSRPADGAMLAKIEYASPGTVAETAQFYDSQMQAARRVELEVGGDNIIVYALSPGTAITTATSYTDVERLMNERTEPMVVVSPWTMQRNDPLIGDLRSAGLTAEADRLLETKSKVTVIYAVQ
jgi:hypothetical protein